MDEILRFVTVRDLVLLVPEKVSAVDFAYTAELLFLVAELVSVRSLPGGVFTPSEVLAEIP